MLAVTSWMRDADPARSAEALARIGRLYAVEKEAAQRIEREKLDGDAADAAAGAAPAKSAPELTSLGQWLETLQKDTIPKSPIGKAAAYTRLNHSKALVRYVEHGWLSIDNNAAERALASDRGGAKQLAVRGKPDRRRDGRDPVQPDFELPPQRHRSVRVPA
ncbi:MAG: transposase [Gemmataceae bacterium]